jgi:hypothetical protein
MAAMKVRALVLTILVAMTAPASAAFLGENPRPDQNFLDAGSRHLASELTREGLPGSGGASLRWAAEFFVAPGAMERVPGTALASPNPPNNGFMADPTPTTLQPGTLIDRYGGPSGYYASPAGTPFEMRALRPEAIQRPLNAYEVLKPIDGINSGLAVPYYGQTGLGMQYEFPVPIQSYIDSGHLRPIP